MEPAAVPGFLREDGLRLLLFGGKGGVGKTTCASAAALDLARRHPAASFLLVSTDPAHSLLDCFAGSAAPKNLALCEIDPQQSLQRFKTQHQEHLRTIALRGTFLDPSDVARFLDLSIPGLDEMMALLEIMAWVKQQRYACIVVDTAPAGHTLKLLGLPALMRRWVAALDAMLAKYRYMARLYRGAYCKEAVDLYLEQTLADLKNLWTLLRSPKRCRFVPVMLAETLSIHVTQVMLRELERLGLPVREVVVNGLLSQPSGCPVCAEWASRQRLELKELTQVFSKYAFWGLPLLLDEVRGAERLLSLWEQARPLAQADDWPLAAVVPGGGFNNVITGHSPVSHPAPLPAASMKLILFAGKGGVGKTTLACASALRLAQERRGKEILLFSIDPAHSLAACLGCEIGAQETRVAPGLSVIELDAQAEYERLKRDYATEISAVFGRGTEQAGTDFAFDREVMERMLDVAPPGLDEMLSLARIVDLMDRKRYDCFVLDTAPTGHLLRFLEMPELIEKWLKTFFALFLKYRDVFWLPRICELMVDLSKKLKLFRRLLVDARQAALLAVTIPTEMAYAETLDLLAACQRLGVAVPILFVNLLTPPSSCPICSALRRAQQPLLERYRTTCADRHLALVFRQDEPRGFERLRVLGRALYAT
ncbi:MAG: ArsA family ATPase [Rhodoferax sp.]|uniref:ArsA family ATPase n=1 Tax=Rhodoferax sp. TaxID=50421 RepID=UPI002625CEB5|nr:ArsA family ATPase [Rhodoferax sp.]MDD5332569.1 ArsA family ATPase [Rhodoferax sp.]